jgi:hypothetical protein
MTHESLANSSAHTFPIKSANFDHRGCYKNCHHVIWSHKCFADRYVDGWALIGEMAWANVEHRRIRTLKLRYDRHLQCRRNGVVFAAHLAAVPNDPMWRIPSIQAITFKDIPTKIAVLENGNFFEEERASERCSVRSEFRRL